MKSMKNIAVTVMMTAALAAPVMAQDPLETQPQREAADKQKAELLQKLASVAIQTRITTGAPYTAEAVTESTQTLADGNRIAKKSVTRVYRDNEGRSRREDLDPETGAVRSVSITDPVAGSTYTLDPATRTAYQNGVALAKPSGFAGVSMGGGRGTMTTTTDAEVAQLKKAMAEAKSSAEGRGGAMVYATGGGGTLPRVAAEGKETTREDLGQQTVEGIVASGTRATTIIPAGAIGNAQPIKIVSEQWTSPDLKVLVLTKHSDPRVGETVYRLSNVVRGEPDRSLFMVPPDYTVKEQFIRREQ